MTTQQQIIAIAEFCGTDRLFYLKKRGYYYRENGAGYTSCEASAGIYTEEEALKHVYPHDEPVTMHPATLPDYCTDLNAIAQAEAKLRGNEVRKYSDALTRLVSKQSTDDDWSEEKGISSKTQAWHATAAQRAEALLRTIGRWSES